MAIIPQGSFIFDANASTPQELARKRAVIAQIMGSRSAPKTIGEGLNALGDGIVANVLGRRADAAEQAGMESASAAFNPLMEAFQRRLGGNEAGFPDAPVNPGNTTSMATMPAPDTASARVAQAFGDNDLRGGILSTAEALGISPEDLATAISYETAGTFDPKKRGPTTQWGQHRGLIQFGEPQAKEHGVDWNNPVGSQLGPNGAVASYLRKAGVQPGMGMLDIYSAINAGRVGRYNASDANNGGAPGTVRDKVEKQMAGHRQKALALLGSTPTASAPAQASASGLTPEMLQQWGANAYAPAQSNDAMAAVNALGTAAPVGVAETEEDILAQELAMMGQDPQAFQQPQGAPQPQAFAPQPAPPLPAPQNVQDMPVAGMLQQPVQMAQAGGFPEMAGNNPRAIPAPGIDMQAIAKVLTNPFSNQEQRTFAQMLLEQQMQQSDPMRQLDMDYKRAQIEKMQRDAAGGSRRYGLNPIYGQDAQGNTVLGVLGDDGSFKPVDTGGVNVSTGVDRVDLGTHYGLLDKRSGQMVGTLPKENYQEAFDTESGKKDAASSVEARAALPRIEDNANAIIGMIDSLSKDQYLDSMVGPMASRLPNITADAARVQSKMDQIGGQAFLQAFEALKGGGTITDFEGQKATEAIARLNTAQSPEDYRAALDELKAIVRSGVERARRSAGQGNGSVSPPGAEGWQDIGGVKIRRKQ